MPPDPIQAVRQFSRFYTSRIGLLQDGLLGGPLTLAEGRVVWELGQAETTASRLAETLTLDPGYLSRLLRVLEANGLIARRASETDGRASLVSLTPSGQAAYDAIDARSAAEVGALLAGLAPPAQGRLVDALRTAETLLGAKPTAIPYVLRPHRPGDMGWVVHRQAVLYAQEYGWDATFEGLLAGIVAAFVANFDPARERCWIAERDGAVVGSVFVVRDTDECAKLRMLYVEPSARGLGIGHRLVDECLRFAAGAGYRRMTLWTNDILVAARRIYQAAGFHLVAEEPHRSFGHDLVGQNWETELTRHAP